MKKQTFDKFGLSETMLQSIADMGFEEATMIQSESIPILLQGNDVIGHAQTGTGKTAAFAIPIIEKIDMKSKNVQAIILCPTRELVIQVTEEFRKLAKYKEAFSVVPIFGGQEIDRQFKSLKKFPQVVIGTPGRVMDHLNRRTLNLKDVKFVVLDEADEMLDMGFREDIEYILRDTTDEKQTIMFSATLPDAIIKLMKTYQKNPIRIDVTHQQSNAPKIEQYYFEIKESSKTEALARLLDLHNIKLALVFCNTKSGVDILVENLKTRGYFAEGLHGDMNQRQREKIMNGFKTGIIEVLVATDVAGRGIDVNNIEAVFNFDLPQDEEDYIHRIGRTGRAGKTGIAFSFVTTRQIQKLKSIERINNIKLIRHQIPTIDDLDATRFNQLRDQLIQIIEKENLKKFLALVEEIIGDDYSSIDVAAALLKMTIDKKNDSFDSNIVIEEHNQNPRNDNPRNKDRNSFQKRNQKQSKSEVFKRHKSTTTHSKSSSANSYPKKKRRK